MYSPSLLTFFCCMTQLLHGFAQSITPFTVTSSAISGTVSCGGCYVVAGFYISTLAPTEAAVTDFSFGPSGLITAGANDNNTFFVFTAYSITSTILIEGQCSAAQGSPETLSPAFAVAVPSGANITAYAATAESLFINDLGGDPTCLAGVQSAVATPQPIVVFDATGFSTITSPPLSSLVVLTGTPSRTSSPTSAASLTSAIALAGTPSSTSPPTMNDASTDLSTGAKAGLGVAIPLGLIALAVLGTYLWIRRRRTRGTHAELDSEIKVEANGEDVRPEMQGNGGKHELLVQERSQELIGDEAARELTGGEHSHELEAPT